MFSEKRLRFSIQTLNGRILDHEEGDSDPGDDESEIDIEDTSDEDSDVDIILNPKRLRSGRGNPGKTKGSRKGFGTGEINPEDYISCRRKEELTSVLRRVRAAVRLMDSVMPEDEVHAFRLNGLIREHNI